MFENFEKSFHRKTRHVLDKKICCTLYFFFKKFVVTEYQPKKLGFEYQDFEKQLPVYTPSTVLPRQDRHAGIKWGIIKYWNYFSQLFDIAVNFLSTQKNFVL